MIGYLRRHPVLCLLLLSPGLPEYLSSSSPINAIFLNPVMFVFQLVANLGLYGPGVLLVREAKVRWNKGWGSVLLLGGAYGILEEGVALSTLFDPKAGPVGSLGVYGHWLGVNWIWAAGIVPFHAIFSISVPMLLLGLALPETVGRSFLSKKKTLVTVGILLTDVIILMAFVANAAGYWMGSAILFFSLVSIGALVLAGRRIPATALEVRAGPGVSVKSLAFVGALFLPSIFVSEGLGQAADLPPIVDFALVIALQALFLRFVVRGSGLGGNRRGTLAFTFGLLVPVIVIGVVAELMFPLTLLLDVALVVFFRRLWREPPPPPDPAAVPPMAGDLSGV